MIQFCVWIFFSSPFRVVDGEKLSFKFSLKSAELSVKKGV